MALHTFPFPHIYLLAASAFKSLKHLNSPGCGTCHNWTPRKNRVKSRQAAAGTEHKIDVHEPQKLMMNFCSVSQAHGLGMGMEKEPVTVTVSSLCEKRGALLYSGSLRDGIIAGALAKRSIEWHNFN